ncbi:MAG: UPF0175 family protein [bacterium]
MICIEIPDEIAFQLRIPQKQVEMQLKRELAIHLVVEGICTLAQGARLAQMDRIAFERLLGERRVPWTGTIDDIKKELQTFDSL